MYLTTDSKGGKKNPSPLLKGKGSVLDFLSQEKKSKILAIDYLVTFPTCLTERPLTLISVSTAHLKF